MNNANEIKSYEALRRVLNEKQISSQEMLNLVKRYKKHSLGKKKEELREKVINGNLKMVFSEAMKFSNRYPTIDFSDLFQSGVEGVAYALDKFSYRKGFRFSTYSMHWIKHKMQKETSMCGFTTINKEAVRFGSMYERCLIECEGDIDKTDDEMSKTMKRSKTKHNLGFAKHSHKILYNTPIVRLDKSYNEDADNSIVDSIPSTDPNSDPERNTVKSGCMDKLKRLMEDVLTSRELMIIKYRYLDKGNENKVLDVARIMKVSRSVVDNYEAIALVKIRRALKKRGLVEDLDFLHL